MANTDSILWHPVVTVEKWNPETVREITDFLGHEPTGDELRDITEPDDYAYAEGNQLVDAGKTRLASLITGSGAAFTNALGVVGVGNSTTLWATNQTALVGTAYYMGLKVGSPTAGAGTITASADFASGVANHAWEEWCWAIATTTPVPSTSFTTATTTGIMFNRKVQSLGTKALGAVWTHTATVTLT